MKKIFCFIISSSYCKLLVCNCQSISHQLIIVNDDSFPVSAQLTKFGPDTVNEKQIDDHGITLTLAGLLAINGSLASFSDSTNKLSICAIFIFSSNSLKNLLIGEFLLPVDLRDWILARRNFHENFINDVIKILSIEVCLFLLKFYMYDDRRNEIEIIKIIKYPSR